MLGTLLRTERVWDKEMLAGNMLFKQILNNFPEHLRTNILHHGLCILKKICKSIWIVVF